MSPVDPGSYDEIVARINKKYSGSLKMGDQIENPNRLSTGSLELDLSMGGGVPVGRITRLAGPYCLSPGTLVLMTDYSWRPIETLVPGEKIVGFDEHRPEASESRGVQRRLKEAEIVTNDIARLPCRRITTHRDKSTVSSLDHLWLIRLSNGRLDWRRTADLVEGDKILFFDEPWGELSQSDQLKAAYLAGIFDGEGWFSVSQDGGMRMQFAQNSGAVLDKSMQFLNDLGFRNLIKSKMHSTGDCSTITAAAGVAENMRFLYQIPAVRMHQRAENFWIGRALTRKGKIGPEDQSYALVTGIEELGTQEVCAVETTSKTLIADGMMSHNSSGKSLQGWSIIRSAQKAGMKCAYYNVEKQYTPEFVSERGVNIDDLTVVDATTIESIGEICESLLGAVHLHVIDSTKAAVSEDALNASIRDWRPGLEARAWGKAFAFLNDKFDYNENIIVLIDQVRIKNFQTGSEEPAGGRVMDHASSMTIMFRKGPWLFYDEEGNLSDKAKQQKNSDNQSVPAGRVIQARVEKSRVSRPLLPATMWLDLNTNFFDRAFELQKAGVSTGLITRSGSIYSYVDPTTGEVESFKGKKPLREFLLTNEVAQEQIRSTAMQALQKR